MYVSGDKKAIRKSYRWLAMDVKYDFLRQRKKEFVSCRNGLFKKAS